MINPYPANVEKMVN